jgi:anti-sigma B factor antagonist
MELSIERHEADGLWVLEVRGEVDLHSSPELRKQIMDAVPNAKSGLEIDLSAVDYMDSSGVATLVEGFKRSRELGVSFVLVNPSQPVTKVLELTRLDSVFEVRKAG